MEQLNSKQTELFWELLANPADKSYTHVQNLRQLVSEYPQSNLLQSLLVYVGEDDNLSHAVAYADTRLLYKLRHDASGLSAVSNDQLIQIISEKRYFHSDTEVHEPETATVPEPEAHEPFTYADLEQQALIDGYQPEEHFFKPEAEEQHAVEAATEETIAEPEKLDDLINYGAEVTEGEHGLVPQVAEFHQPDHAETEVQTTPVHEEPVTEENAPVQEVEHIAPQEEQPAAEAAEPAGPVIEQQIPLEAIHPEPVLEQEIELPTLGFYVPSQEAREDEAYNGGDISSKLFESYAETFEHTPQPQPAPQPIEDDVFDEIVGIDDIEVPMPESFNVPNDEVPQSPQPVEEVKEPALGFETPPVTTEAETPKEDLSAAKNRRMNLNDEADKLMLNNIAATDFFVFDQALRDSIKPVDEVKETVEPIAQAQPEVAEPAPQNTDSTAKPGAKKVEYQRVTKYFDEKMPYSFMWWLDKTRKEHSGIYQPFVLDTTQQIEQVEKTVPDELQQQYYENIFSLTSVDELERATGNEPVVYDSRKKEDDIIERFIHESPQIKPQTSEKLDNENKAKRSSEDQDEIVSETLAQIYIDQMLYHKAIKVYQKLILKFPEKRRYFAGQIEQLEKKVS